VRAGYRRRSRIQWPTFVQLAAGGRKVHRQIAAQVLMTQARGALVVTIPQLKSRRATAPLCG
jgi:hypothetical protein